MAEIAIRGVPHYYEWIAAEPRNDKPTMVFMHGWGGSARYWASTAEALKPYFNCLLYDLRGFGRSRPSEVSAVPPATADYVETYGIETYADDLAALLTELNTGPVYLNGHSTGSSMAVLFLNRYPQQVKKAILTCSGIFEYEEKSFSQFYKFGGYVVQFRPKWLSAIPGVDRMFMARFLTQSIPASERKAFLEDFLMADYGAAIGTMFSAVSERAALEMPKEFEQLSVPTLVVSGEFDQIIPAAMGEKAAGLSDKVEFVVIPKTGHFPMLEDAKTYLAKISEFLEIA